MFNWSPCRSDITEVVGKVTETEEEPQVEETTEEVEQPIEEERKEEGRYDLLVTTRQNAKIVRDSGFQIFLFIGIRCKIVRIRNTARFITLFSFWNLG